MKLVFIRMAGASDEGTYKRRTPVTGANALSFTGSDGLNIRRNRVFVGIENATKQQEESDMKQALRILSILFCVSIFCCCAAPRVPSAESALDETPAPEVRPAQVAEPPIPASEKGGTKVWPDPGIEGYLADTPSPKDDLAAYFNYEWYKNTTIPDGYSRWTSFSILAQSVRERMIETLKTPDNSPDQQKAAILYQKVLNAKARDEAGLGSLRKTLDALLAVTSIGELNTLFAEDEALYYLIPLIRTESAPDTKNSAYYAAYVQPPALSLGDSAEYAQLTEQGTRKKAANEKFYKALLTHNGIDSADADAMIKASFDWETELAKGVYPLETSYRDDYVEMTYNEYLPDAFFQLAPNVPYQAVFQYSGLDHASRFIVQEPEALKTLNAIYTDANLPGIKAYLITNLLSSVSACSDSFSDEARILWDNETYGSAGRKSDESRAYDLCNFILDELMGKIYAEKYFDQSSKDDITDMVYEIFDVYKSRLNAADWLSDATRQVAIEKLDHITLRIGYPEVFRFDWDAIDILPDTPLIEDYIRINAERMRRINEEFEQPVNKALWDMSANTVNAYYDPTDNSINFPAAILLPPFYSRSATRSQNLGGIGNVIAHEITHAFDTSGSQFDADGNLKNWWTDEDRAAFKSRTDKVDAYFSSIEVINGEHVRGDLTIGETVADLGAVACTLDILRTLDDPDYEGYFKVYAETWQERITPETRIHLLSVDPHAPTYLRANVTLQQFAELYDTYDIVEGDFMYIAPENRLAIW